MTGVEHEGSPAEPGRKLLETVRTWDSGSGKKSEVSPSSVGFSSIDRSFPWTIQNITLPPECRTTTTRFRFQAKGSSAWTLSDPGWSVDNVIVN